MSTLTSEPARKEELFELCLSHLPSSVLMLCQVETGTNELNPRLLTTKGLRYLTIHKSVQEGACHDTVCTIPSLSSLQGLQPVPCSLDSPLIP